jgi:hypothetical protein
MISALPERHQDIGRSEGVGCNLRETSNAPSRAAPSHGKASKKNEGTGTRPGVWVQPKFEAGTPASLRGQNDPAV